MFRFFKPGTRWADVPGPHKWFLTMYPDKQIVMQRLTGGKLDKVHFPGWWEFI